MFAASARAVAANASNSCGAIGAGSDATVLSSSNSNTFVDTRKDALCDHILTRAVKLVLAAVGGDDRHLVVGAVEADAGCGDVVDDDRVQRLALKLLAPVGDRVVAGLGGEP